MLARDDAIAGASLAAPFAYQGWVGRLCVRRATGKEGLPMNGRYVGYVAADDPLHG